MRPSTRLGFTVELVDLTVDFGFAVQGFKRL